MATRHSSHPVELSLVSAVPPAPARGPQVASEPPQAVLHVAEATADALRIAPVADALARHASLRQTLVHAGADPGGWPADRAIDALGLPSRRRALALAPGTHAERTAQAMCAFELVLLEEAPAVVVVAGDGDATLACALSAAKLAVPVLHLEGGLRAADWSTPEEVNRALTDRLSDTLLVHGADARRNLVAEGVGAWRVHEVGNTMVDALRRHERRARVRATWATIPVAERGYVLAVFERPSNVDDEERMAAIAAALGEVARAAPVVYALGAGVEPRPGRWRELLVRHSVACVGPLGYLDLLSLKAGAGAVVTDAGLVQDETSALGVPCYTLRTTTERLMTLTHGTNVLLGEDPEAIAAVQPEAPAPDARELPLWDGRAAQRAAEVLVAQHVLSVRELSA
jgi:UDP-N-acetylglucosamine 2-epimerase (non-hydrolysing)